VWGLAVFMLTARIFHNRKCSCKSIVPTTYNVNCVFLIARGYVCKDASLLRSANILYRKVSTSQTRYSSWRKSQFIFDQSVRPSVYCSPKQCKMLLLSITVNQRTRTDILSRIQNSRRSSMYYLLRNLPRFKFSWKQRASRNILANVSKTAQVEQICASFAIILTTRFP